MSLMGHLWGFWRILGLQVCTFQITGLLAVKMTGVGLTEKCIPGGSKSEPRIKVIFTASRLIGLLGVKIADLGDFPFFREALQRPDHFLVLGRAGILVGTINSPSTGLGTFFKKCHFDTF